MKENEVRDGCHLVLQSTCLACEAQSSSPGTVKNKELYKLKCYLEVITQAFKKYKQIIKIL